MTTSRWRASVRSTALMNGREANGVETLNQPQMRQAQAEHRRTGKAARFSTEYEYETWEICSRARRAVVKPEQVGGWENPHWPQG